MLSEAINKLTTHSYIAKCQARYLRQQKEKLTKDCCIVLGDFAENYTFVIQDEIQNYHWCKTQCTLDPVALYLLNENDQLKEKSFCFLSEDNEHDTGFVYEVQTQIVNYLKE